MAIGKPGQASGVRLRAAHARRLALRELGCSRVKQAGEDVRAALTAYDVALARGHGLAFYEAGSAGRTVIPVGAPGSGPLLRAHRFIAEAGYSFDGGGFGGTGTGGDYVAEIRPGLDAAWHEWDEGSTDELCFDSEDVVELAARTVSDWPMRAGAVDGLIGGDIAAKDMGEEYDWYEGFARVNLDPQSDDGRRFLRALSERLNGDSPVKRGIDAFLIGSEEGE